MTKVVRDELATSEEDPYTWEIARIRKSGEVAALRQQIENIKRFFACEAWNDTESGGRYKKLGDAITRVEHELKKMRLLLAAIQDIDMNHS